jgi:hypothetical protein
MSQLSLFGAAAREPALADLEGLLAGNGQVVRRADSARLSVVVDDGWRVDALVAALSRSLGLSADVAPAEAGTAVGTPWLAELRPLADSWTRGAGLRWWCLSAGRQGAGMYTLALGASDEHAWTSVGSALAMAGVPGALVGPRADGPAYRIVGRRRLVRLMELVGDRPAGVPDDAWPALH